MPTPARKPDAPACPNCGKRLVGAEADAKLHRTVERIVRPGQRYGIVAANVAPETPGMPGTRVRVEAREVGHPSVQAATMSPAEAKDFESRIRARQSKAAQPGALKAAVEAAFAASQAEVRMLIDRGKRAAEHRARPMDEEQRRPAGPPIAPDAAPVLP